MQPEHSPHDPNETAAEQPFVPAVDVAGLLKAPELSPEQKWGKNSRAIGALLLKDARDVTGNQGPGTDEASYVFLPSEDFGQIRIHDYYSSFASGFDPNDARGSRDTMLRSGAGILTINFKLRETELSLIIATKSSIDPHAGFVGTLLAKNCEEKRDDEVVAVLMTGNNIEPVNPYSHPKTAPLLEFMAAKARTRTGEGTPNTETT